MALEQDALIGQASLVHLASEKNEVERCAVEDWLKVSALFAFAAMGATTTTDNHNFWLALDGRLADERTTVQ